MFFAALPWTYWMALPLLVGSLIMLVGFGLVYLKKVVEPHVLYMDALSAARASASFAGAGSQRPAVSQRNQLAGPGAHRAAISSGAGSMKRAS